MDKQDKFLWCESYRPRTVSDCILPPQLKDSFQTFVDDMKVPNMILSGPAGTGKTSVAKAMLEEIGSDYIVINGSMNGNIDTLRTTIQQFASTVSFGGGRKYVILDEADYLSNLTQASLRNFMEEYSENCGFILTCNYKNRIIDPLHSRCSVIEFKFDKSDIQDLAVRVMQRVSFILKNESIEYDPKAVALVVRRHMPDWRRIINEVQRYSATGKIDMGIAGNDGQEGFQQLVDFMKSKNYTGVRTWVGEQVFDDSANLFRAFYDHASNLFTASSIPLVVVTLAKYQQFATEVADQEINLAACLAELMIEAEFNE